MKVVKKDLKEGIITVTPESPDDLWVLEKTITKGDTISGHTLRNIKIRQGDKQIRTGRKRIFIKLEVEKAVFSGEEVRISGMMLETSEGERAHHTFEIQINKPVTIQKKWKQYEIDRLEKSKKKQPKILVIALDDSEAGFAMLTGKLEMLTTIYGNTGKSMGEQDNTQYYSEIIKYLKEKESEKIILAGPGFTKENVMNLIKKKEPELVDKIFVDSVSYAGEAGIQEALRRGIVEKVVEESDVGDQSALVEKFFATISKNDKVVYGKKETEKAIEMGAVRELLVSSELVRESEEIMKKAEEYGATVFIIDNHHEAGKRFLIFSGIAGFLRFEI
jgi:protein pelota